MSEGPSEGGTVFVSGEADLSPITAALGQTVSTSETLLNQLTSVFTQFEQKLGATDIDPLHGLVESFGRDVSQIAQQTERLVASIKEAQAAGEKPVTFDLQYREQARQTLGSAVGKLDQVAGNVPGYAEFRKTLVDGASQMLAEFGRSVQSGLRKELQGVADNVADFVGPGNNSRLRGQQIAQIPDISGAQPGPAGIPGQRQAPPQTATSGAGGGSQPPNLPPTPAAAPPPDDASNAQARVVAGAQRLATAEEKLAEAEEREASQLAALQQDFADRLAHRDELPPEERVRRFSPGAGFDPTLDENERVISLNHLKPPVEDHPLGENQPREFAPLNDIEQAFGEQRAHFELLRDRVNAQNASLKIAERELVETPDFFIDRAGQSSLGPDVFTKRGTTALPASTEEIERALQQERIAIESETRATQRLEAARLRTEAIETKAALRAEASGPAGSFKAGLLSGGFFGDGPTSNTSGVFDGLSRAAGTATKYTLLYQTLGLLQGALTDVVKQFLDANDSVTELEVAMNGASTVTGDFVNQLGDVAAVGGFNVGEAMDVAASGIRAFKDSTDGSEESINRLGSSFATQASRIAVLSKTTLTDAAGNLKAITDGFGLQANNAGFSQVADAIAGAKLAGGGNEKDIGQGLANSALIFKELGFSLNEAANTISTINSATDESGTLIATRVSRLSSIIGGSSGRNFIANLNQSLAPSDRIDAQATVKDQLEQLAKVYQGSTDAMKRQIVSALGGTAQARELIVLLSQMQKITRSDDGGLDFAGKATKEFQKRLENVRAQLDQIKGNVTQIITNVANSGIAAPVVALVDGLRGVTSILREVTQLLNLIPTGFIAAAASAGALYGAIRLIGSIRRSGGIGNFFAQQEERLLPQNALARAQLQTLNEAKAGANEVRVGTGGASSLRLAEASGAVSLTGEALVAQRGRVAEARDDLAKVRRGEGNIPDAERAQAEQAALARVVAAQRELAALEGRLADQGEELREARRAQAAVTRNSRNIDREERDAGAAFAHDSRTADREITAAQASGDTQRIEAAYAARAAIEERFNLTIAELEARREAIEAAGAGAPRARGLERAEQLAGRARDAASGIATGARGVVVDPFKESLAAGRTFTPPGQLLLSGATRAQGLSERASEATLGAASAGLDRVRTAAIGAATATTAGLDRVRTGVTSTAGGVAAAAAAVRTGLAELAAGLAAVAAAAASGARRAGPAALSALDAKAQGVAASLAATRGAIIDHGLLPTAGDLVQQGTQGAGGLAGRIGDTLRPPDAFSRSVIAEQAASLAPRQGSLSKLGSVIGGELNQAGERARGAMGRITGTITGGLTRTYEEVGRITRAALASIEASARAVGTGIGKLPDLVGPGSKARGFASKAFDAVGGPIGIAIAGATIASELYSAANAIHDARKNIVDLTKNPDPAKGEAPRTFTADEFQNRLDTARSARENADSARSGVFGSIADLLTGGEGTQTVHQADALIAANQSNLAFVKASQDAAGLARVSSTDVSQLIDTSSAQGVDTSLQDLAAAGRGAKAQLDALIGSLERISQTGLNATTALSAPERTQIEAAGGDAAVRAATAAAQTQDDVPGDTPGSTIKSVDLNTGHVTYEVPGFDFNGDKSKQVNDKTRQAVDELINQGVDLSSDSGKAKLVDKLQQYYKGLIPDGVKIAQVANNAANAIQEQIKTVSTPQQRADTLAKLAANTLTAAANNAKVVGNQSKLRALSTGGLDNSAVDEANTLVASLQQNRDIVIAAYKATGATDDQVAFAIEQYDEFIVQSKIQALQAKQQQAERDIALLTKDTNNKALLAPNVAALNKIKGDYFNTVFAKALDAKDQGAITSLFNGGATDQQIAGARKGAENDFKQKQQKAKEAQDAYDKAISANRTAELIGEKTGQDIPVPVGPQTLALLKGEADRTGADASGAKSILDLITTAIGQTDRPTGDQISAAQQAAAAASTGDTVQGARANLASAQADYNKIRADVNSNPKQIADALARVNAAQLALSKDVLEQSIAARNVGAFRDSQLDTADRNYRDATDRLNAARRRNPNGDNSAEEDAKIQAGRAQQLAHLNNDQLGRELTIDLTDPVRVAKDAVTKAREKLALLRRQNQPQDVIRQAELDLRGRQNDQESATFNENVSHAQALEAAQRISHSQYIQLLQKERARIAERLRQTKAGTNGYKQLQDELLSLDAKIKDAGKQLSGQFNLGDIKVPTVYEVRRSLAASTASTAISNAPVTNNQTNNIAINGVDIDKALAALKRQLQADLASKRSGSGTRKG